MGARAGRVETIAVVLNFSEADQLVNVPFPARGTWKDGLASFFGGPDWTVDVAGPAAAVPVGSHWGRILIHRP